MVTTRENEDRTLLVLHFSFGFFVFVVGTASKINFLRERTIWSRSRQACSGGSDRRLLETVPCYGHGVPASLPGCPHGSWPAGTHGLWELSCTLRADGWGQQNWAGAEVHTAQGQVSKETVAPALLCGISYREN